MKKIILFTIVSACAFFISFNVQQEQEDMKSLLPGKWNEVKRTQQSGQTLTARGRPYTAGDTYIITGDQFTFWYTEAYQNTFNYVVKGNIINLVRVYFKIEKITNDSLILSDFEPKYPKSTSGFIHYCVRVKK